MESKYYTPEIEEFYVGFECELKNSSDPINFEWEKFKIIGVDDAEISNHLMDWSFYNSQNAINNQEIRVKYLDREDIESLGWDHDQTSKDGAYFYFGDLLTKNMWCLNAVNARLSKGNDYTYIFIWDIHKESRNNFEGIIKNKSELKILMQQLQINER